MRHPPGTHRISGSRELDFDHVGAEIGEELPAVGSRNELAQLNHSNTFKWFHPGAFPV